MAHMESPWPRLAELPLVVESCEYDRLHAVLAHGFQRVTTHVRLVGAGGYGLGEDVSVHVEDGTSLHGTQPALPLAGEWTLAGFCDHLATVDPWPTPPEWEAARRFRIEHVRRRLARRALQGRRGGDLVTRARRRGRGDRRGRTSGPSTSTPTDSRADRDREYARLVQRATRSRAARTGRRLAADRAWRSDGAPASPRRAARRRG